MPIPSILASPAAAPAGASIGLELNHAFLLLDATPSVVFTGNITPDLLP